MPIAPVVETAPIPGFNPTNEAYSEGQMIEPSVSPPNATVTKFAATATAEPELEPQGLLVILYALFVCPPRPLQPLGRSVPLKLEIYEFRVSILILIRTVTVKKHLNDLLSKF